MRVLAPGDEPALAAFFARHPYTTGFFQGNLRAGGLVDRSEVYQGTWVAALEDDTIAALCAHFWNGNVVLEAPRAVEALVREAVRASGRPVTGLLGPRVQVETARAALGLEGERTLTDSVEDLFALELAWLRVPPPLAAGTWSARAPRAGELDELARWRHDYRVVEIGEPPGDELLARSRDEVERYQREDKQFVLVAEDRAVAYCAYNAETPQCVQIGGVWTPPAWRCRGYGRAVVAGALLEARRRGVPQSVLFTDVRNRPAQAAYRALGYGRVGDYGIVLFAGGL